MRDVSYLDAMLKCCNVAGACDGAGGSGENAAAAVPGDCGLPRRQYHVLSQGLHLPAAGQALRPAREGDGYLVKLCGVCVLQLPATQARQ